MLKIYTDGASSGNPGPGWAMWVIVNAMPKREKRTRLEWCTNNEAEYKAVIYALEDLSANPSLHEAHTEIGFHIDSNLVVQQVNGLFKVKNAKIREYIFRINTLVAQLGKKITFNYIPREENLADRLKYD